MRGWWNGLSGTQQELFILCGLAGIFVVGLVVGIYGVNHILVLEPLVHLGFGSALVSLLTALGYTMARI